MPFVADKGNQLFIKGSWVKGGRDHCIPIHTPEQRQWLNEAKHLVKHKNRSLIPKDTSYKTYRSRFNKTCQRADINHCHGHWYAQQRYYELTGWQCHAKNGPSRGQLTKEQRVVDQQARLQVSYELGHSRINITSVYLGS